MEETPAAKLDTGDALGYRCAKCRYVRKPESDNFTDTDYCDNPETQRVGLGILNVLWKQINELYEHNILSYDAHKGIEGHIKRNIEQVQDYGVPLNTPYNQKCFAAKEDANG